MASILVNELSVSERIKNISLSICIDCFLYVRMQMLDGQSYIFQVCRISTELRDLFAEVKYIFDDNVFI